MTLPLHALTDDECAHYAGVDPAAAAECARRSADGHGSYLHALERQKLRIEHLESELEDAEERASESDDLEDDVRKALEELAKADAHMGTGQLLELIERARVALGAEG